MNGNNKQNTETTTNQTQPKTSVKSNVNIIDKFLKSRNNNLLIVLGLFAGIIFIVLSFLIPNKTDKNDSVKAVFDADTSIEFSRMSTDEYIREQEKKLCEVLKRVKGISDPYVMITLDSSSEYIYAVKKNTKESSSVNGGNMTSNKETQSDIVLYSDVQKQESPLLITEIQPRIKGVAVVCKGLGNAEMQLKIINLVSTVLNLPTNRVYVISSD